MSKNKVTVKKGGWKLLLKRVTPLSDYAAHVGILASKGGNDFHKASLDANNSKITLLELAAIHEFGSPAANIPERSFLRSAFNDPEGKKELKALYAKLAKAVVSGRMSAEKAIELLGMKMAAMVKNRIVQGVWPPNRPTTVERKGSSTPLVDTGQLYGAITYEIRSKK
jgi:phage gpG-like protein